jgi:hypothetical protein
MVQWLQLKKLKFQQTICLWTSHKMGYLNFNAILTELHITFSLLTSQLSVRHGKEGCHKFTEKEFQLSRTVVQHVTQKNVCPCYWDGERLHHIWKRSYIGGRQVLVSPRLRHMPPSTANGWSSRLIEGARAHVLKVVPRVYGPVWGTIAKSISRASAAERSSAQLLARTWEKEKDQINAPCLD